MPTQRERNRKVVDSLTLQSPTADQGRRMDAVRKSAQQFAKVVVKHTESGPESTLAQRHIEQAVFYAIRSVFFDFAPVDPANATPVKKASPVKKATVKKTVRRRA